MASENRRPTAPGMRAKKKAKVRYFRLRNKLKDKAGSGVAGGSLGFASEALEEAMAEISKFSEGFPEWVSGSVNQLVAALKVAQSAPEKERYRPYRKINEIAHDMRGQGGTFGYPLITTFAKSLHQFTGRSAGTTDDHVEIVKAHIDTMNVVIRERIDGDGGTTGAELIEALELAIEKFSRTN